MSLMPKFRTCDACLGLGTVWITSTTHHNCNMCKGKGSLQLMPSKATVPCGTCGGEGKIPHIEKTSKACSVCQGLGQIEA